MEFKAYGVLCCWVMFRWCVVGFLVVSFEQSRTNSLYSSLLILFQLLFHLLDLEKSVVVYHVAIKCVKIIVVQIDEEILRLKIDRYPTNQTETPHP